MASSLSVLFSAIGHRQTDAVGFDVLSMPIKDGWMDGWLDTVTDVTEMVLCDNEKPLPDPMAIC